MPYFKIPAVIICLVICLLQANISIGQHLNLWGTTYSGGTNSRGQIFKYNTGTDSLQYVYSFGTTGAKNLSSGIIWDSGSRVFYGTTTYGGLSGSSQGTIFKYDPLYKKLTTIFDCYPQSVGQTPIAQLLQIGPALLIGTDYSGGQHSYGAIYTFKPSTGSKTLRKHFWPSQGDGYDAYQGPVPGKNGKFYGLTHGSNGAIGSGALYEFDTSNNSYAMKKELTGVLGNQPYGRLLCLPSGHFLGVTSLAGAGNAGVLFEYDPKLDSIWVRHSFNSSASGSSSMGFLTLHSNGKVYGMTSSGGAFGRGVLFEYDTLTRSLSPKYHFRDSTGGTPRGGLTLASNGKLYGCTGSFGQNGYGALFEYEPTSNIFSAKKHFSGGGPLYVQMVEVWTNERPQLLTTGASDTVCNGNMSTVFVSASDGDADTLSAVFVSSHPSIIPAASIAFNYVGNNQYSLAYATLPGSSGDVELKGYVKDNYGGTSADTFFVFVHVQACGLSTTYTPALNDNPVVSPNPFRDKLVITRVQSKVLRLTTTDVLGQSYPLSFTTTSDHSVEAETRRLAPGNYLLRMSLANGNTLSLKITKEL